MRAKERSGKEMPRYTFKLRDDGDGVEDDNGVNLPDAEIAYGYACDVVRELMNCRERSTRSWQLEVYENGQEKIFEIPFVRLDQTLDHLNAQMRERAGRNSHRVTRPHPLFRQMVRPVFHAECWRPGIVIYQKNVHLVTRAWAPRGTGR